MEIKGLNLEQIDYILRQWGEDFDDSEDFLEYLRDDFFKVGEILDSGGGNKIKILRKL